MRSAVAVCLFLLAVSGCGAGEGGTITVPCDETRCNEMCVGSGNESGACREDMCLCRPRLDLPSGATSGLSSGGVVSRRSARYQLDMSVAPVAPAAERGALEMGIVPQTDPERGLPGR